MAEYYTLRRLNKWEFLEYSRKSESYPEDRIEELLSVFFDNRNFYREVAFSEFIKNRGLYRFDFFIPIIDLIIEYDGKQHKGSKDDKEKDLYCKMNGIEVYRFNSKNFVTLELDLTSKLFKNKKFMDYWKRSIFR